MVRMNEACAVPMLARVRAELGGKGDCVLKSTYLAGDPFLPPPRSDEVHSQAASEKSAGGGDLLSSGRI